MTTGFSPVKLPASPGLGQVGNLTGYPRRVKDGVAECYQYYQNWIKLSNEGAKVITDIANLKLTSCDMKEEMVSQKLQELCDSLQNIYFNLKEISENMNKLRQQFECLKELTSSPLFLTWTMDKFCDTVRVFEDSMKRELLLRNRIIELVAHTSNKDYHVLYYTMWTHSPYMDLHLDRMIDALLIETGHKPYL